MAEAIPTRHPKKKVQFGRTCKMRRTELINFIVIYPHAPAEQAETKYTNSAVELCVCVESAYRQ